MAGQDTKQFTVPYIFQNVCGTVLLLQVPSTMAVTAGGWLASAKLPLRDLFTAVFDAEKKQVMVSY